MSRPIEQFDRWIRSSFVEMNTELETLYFARDDRCDVAGVGDGKKAVLFREGHALATALAGDPDVAGDFDTAFDALGILGYFLASLRRHELTNPDREDRSPFAVESALAEKLGAACGTAPRLLAAHMMTHNPARYGLARRFTSLPEELLFNQENTRGILALQRAADALARIVPIGVANPAADVLFRDAGGALGDVAECNERLYRSLDVDRFFFSVRPYFKPHRIGAAVYRGANAGDVSAINQIDLLLGLCRADDPIYAQILREKMPFLHPTDQARLKQCMTRRSLLDELLLLADGHAGAQWYQTSARAFLDLCEQYGRIAHQHHDQLVARFIAAPAERIPARHREGLTTSGPPMPVMLRLLEVLRDYRCAVARDDGTTRNRDVERIRGSVGR